MPTSLANSGVV